MRFHKQQRVLRKIEIPAYPASEDQAGSLELWFGGLDWHSEDKGSQSEVSGAHLHFTLVVFLSHVLSVMLRSTTKTKQSDVL